MVLLYTTHQNARKTPTRRGLHADPGQWLFRFMANAQTRLNDAGDHVRHTGSFVVHIPPGHALPLFSPEGERLWVDGWNPAYLHPQPFAPVPGAVFRTDHGSEETLWLVLQFNSTAGVAEYARVTPGSRMGTVRVTVQPHGPSSTRVEVTYELTALSAAGRAVLAQMTPSAYAQMMADWEARIQNHVQTLA